MRFALLALALCCGAVCAQERPRIGLVLSGGGARGIAHIGVLQVLEEQQIPIDIVVGTSMGAVVGGAYVAGRSPRELAALVRQADWAAILADRPARERLAFRRREDDQLVPSRIEFGLLLSTGVTLPSGAAGNSQLEATLNALLPAEHAETPLRALPVPFRAVATDLLSGDMVTQDQTPLFKALRASMAVPGVFAPLRVNGRPLVDGGLVRNLPIDVARQLGAEIIIAVNVGTPLLEERELTSAVAVANQMINILTEQNVQRSLKQLLPDDMVIDPNLGDISFMDFARAEEALAIGRRAAEAAVQRLRALSNPVAYAQLQARRQVPPDPTTQALPLAALQFTGAARTQPDTLRPQLPLQLGQAATQADIDRSLQVLHGTEDYERIEVQTEDREGQRHVEFKLSEAAWASSRVRFGLEMYSNFSESNHFSLVGMHVANWINSWGAELRSVARIGSRRGLSSEFYQPLGVASPWFGSAQIGYEAGSDDVFNQGQRALRQASSLSNVQLALGHRLGSFGDVRVGVGGLRASAEVLIPAPVDGARASRRYGQRFIELHTDTLDSLAFPSQGHWLTARVEWLQPSGQAQAVNATVIALKAFQWGEWAGQLYGERAHAESGTARSLGGYLRLSGTPDRSLVAENVTLARLVMARRLGHMPVALGGAVRVGFSLEMGGVSGGPLLAPLTDSRWHQAVSGFLSVDTRFGPFHLALGATRQGGSAVYLLLGPTW